jgi:pilus assembly protein CpaF
VERHRDGGRRITQVTEICGMEGDTVMVNDIAQLDILGTGPDGRLRTQYTISRARPRSQKRLAYFGLDGAWMAALGLDEAI